MGLAWLNLPLWFIATEKPKALEKKAESQLFSIVRLGILAEKLLTGLLKKARSYTYMLQPEILQKVKQA
jgi:hypothetical protein